MGKRPELSVLTLGVAVALCGDACHVAAGVTRYEWDGVPMIWRSAIWFPLLVGGGVLGLSSLGSSRARAPARDPLVGAGAVLAIYALTALAPELAGTVLTAALALVLWRWWDVASWRGGAIAAIAGPLVEIAIVHAGAASYTADYDGLLGVAPFLIPLYFAAGCVAWRLRDVLAG